MDRKLVLLDEVQMSRQREFEQKIQGQSTEKQRADGDGLMAIFAGLGAIRNADPTGSEAQALVKKLQDYISEHFYTCTNQILSGLGQMYTADERFQTNIDRHGSGTAAFVCSAIAAYCA